MNDTPVEAPSRIRARTKRRPRMWLRLAVILIVLALLGAGLVAFHRFKAGILKQITTNISQQLPTVATSVASLQMWQPTQSATGTLRASAGASMASEVAGVVDTILFKSGEDIPAGTVLLRLRPDDDNAKLAGLQATADLDAITHARDLRQLHAQGVSQETVDTDAGNLRNARAQVNAQVALMAEKVVQAPFAGRLGIRQVDPGQYLNAGTAIVSLEALDPIYIDFYLPQSSVADVSTGQSVTIHTDAFPGKSFPGKVLAIDATVDQSSRMVQVRATVPNADHALLPGMYATAEIAAGSPVSLVTIPEVAISYNPYGSLVYTVAKNGSGPDGKPRLVARQQFVTTGAARGNQVSILSGLKAGETVVTAGQIKLHNGATVLVNNAVQPAYSANPPRNADQN